jgi:ABC-2 type transport system ATP-binding protein
VNGFNHAGGGIVLSRLSKSYGAVRAVDAIDLTIESGETVALLGPNGAGKSTTLDMVLGLAGPDSGRVAVFGCRRLRRLRPAWWGGMLQTGSPADHRRVGELVCLIASYYPQSIAVDEVLELTGLGGLAARSRTSLSRESGSSGALGSAQRLMEAARLHRTADPRDTGPGGSQLQRRVP